MGPGISTRQHDGVAARGGPFRGIVRLHGRSAAHREQTEHEVARLGRDLALGVSELVDQQGQKLRLLLGLARDELVGRLERALLDVLQVVRRALCQRLDEQGVPTDSKQKPRGQSFALESGTAGGPADPQTLNDLVCSARLRLMHSSRYR